MSFSIDAASSDAGRTERIRQLNDALRRTGVGGTIVCTAGVRACGLSFVQAAASAVAQFDSFTADNDPYGEHDCASLTIDGHPLIWKIDYYDLTMRWLSADPAHPDQTNRVLTIMLAEEY